MNKETITARQGITIIIMFLIGSTFTVGSPKAAKQDGWIAILGAAVLVLPLFFIFARLIKLHPGKNLCEILEDVFGKHIGKVVTVLFALYALYLGALVVRNFTEFIRISNFPETPPYIFEIVMGITCIYMVKSGVEVMGRWGGLILPVLATVIFASFLLLTNKMDPNNLKPVLAGTEKTVFNAATDQFSFPYAETVILLMLFGSLKDGKGSFRVYFLGSGIFTVISLCIFFRNILVLGDFYSKATFPAYTAVGLAQVGSFLERIEVIVAIVLTLCGIIKISVCLMAASKGLAHAFSLDDYRPMVMPLTLVMILFSATVYKSSMEMFNFVRVYKYFAFPFQVVFPLIVWIIAEIKQKHKAKKPAQAQPSQA